MRVISQDGITDIPYENFAFSILNNGMKYEIAAVKNVAELPEVFMHSLIATYSTEEKAIKAMKMLREAYMAKVKFFNSYGHGYEVGLNKVFKFPQDNEIEV